MGRPVVRFGIASPDHWCPQACCRELFCWPVPADPTMAPRQAMDLTHPAHHTRAARR
jgi:hypothetical protein